MGKSRFFLRILKTSFKIRKNSWFCRIFKIRKIRILRSMFMCHYLSPVVPSGSLYVSCKYSHLSLITRDVLSDVTPRWSRDSKPAGQVPHQIYLASSDTWSHAERRELCPWYTYQKPVTDRERVAWGPWYWRRSDAVYLIVIYRVWPPGETLKNGQVFSGPILITSHYNRKENMMLNVGTICQHQQQSPKP